MYSKKLAIFVLSILENHLVSIFALVLIFEISAFAKVKGSRPVIIQVEITFYNKFPSYDKRILKGD